jgi:hypothetical protein
MKTPTVLVTGATGNVGRPLVAGLLADGARVRALTRNPAAGSFPAGVAAAGGDYTAPGIPLPPPVPVADVGPRLGALAVTGAADRVGFGAHQRLGKGLHHRAQQIRAGLSELLLRPARHIDTGSCGHRVAPSHRLFGRTQ